MKRTQEYTFIEKLKEEMQANRQCSHFFIAFLVLLSQPAGRYEKVNSKIAVEGFEEDRNTKALHIGSSFH